MVHSLISLKFLDKDHKSFTTYIEQLCRPVQSCATYSVLKIKLYGVADLPLWSCTISQNQTFYNPPIHFWTNYEISNCFIFGMFYKQVKLCKPLHFKMLGILKIKNLDHIFHLFVLWHIPYETEHVTYWLFKENTGSLAVYFDLCPTPIKDCHTLHCTEL